MNEMPLLHAGRCLCGGVRYRVTGGLPDFEICHCRQCQRAGGGACVVVAPILASSFELLVGSELLASFQATPGKERLFCKRCGSPLCSRRHDKPEQLRLRVGTLIDTGDARVASHAYVASKLDWFDIGDEAARYAGPRPT